MPKPRDVETATLTFNVRFEVKVRPADRFIVQAEVQRQLDAEIERIRRAFDVEHYEKISSPGIDSQMKNL